MLYFVDLRDGKTLHDTGDTAWRFSDRKRYMPLTKKEHDDINDERERLRKNMRDLKGRHKGATIHVFGNGPSLNEWASRIDWTDHITIGVNAAPMHIRPLAYWLTVDDIKRVEVENGQKVVYSDRDLDKWIRRWMDSDFDTTKLVREGIVSTFVPFGQEHVPHVDGAFTHCHGAGDDDPRMLHWRGSSVVACVDLAIKMGASKVCIWGVDYNDKSHSYTGSEEIPNDVKDRPGEPWKDLQEHVKGFEEVLKYARNRGCEIVNMNPSSNLHVFPKVDPERVIPDMGLQVVERKPLVVSFSAQIPAEATVVQEPVVEDDPIMVSVPTGPKSSRVEVIRVEHKWPRLHVFFTPGTSYEEEAAKCVEAWASKGVTVTPVPMRNKKDWMKNCLSRAPILEEIARAERGLWTGMIDADVVPVKEPLLIRRLCQEDIMQDVVVHDRGPEWEPDWDRYCAGLVVFAPTDAGRNALKEWAKMCKKDPNRDQRLREQAYLTWTLERLKADGLRICNVGDQYGFVKPKGREAVGDAVLVHTPASRRFLEEIGGKR